MDLINRLNIPNWVYLGLAVLVIIYLLNQTKVVVLPPSEKIIKVNVPIDLNGTDYYATFIGTGSGQNDKLMINTPDGWVDIIDQTNLSSLAATYSGAAADFDHTGKTDLVINRADGVTLYLNHGKGRFEKRKLSDLPGDPTSSVAITDYNKDGHTDMYISRSNGANTLLEGVGRGVFEDVTELTGTAGSVGQGRNSTGAAWIDVDGDKLPDLVIGMDNGGTEIYRNTRGASGGKFTSGPLFYHMKDSEKTLTEQLNSIAVEEVVQPGVGHPGGYVAGLQDGTANLGNNFIGVRLPDNNQFMNATIRVVSVNQETGKIRRQSKQLVRTGESLKVLNFDLGNDDRIMHLEVTTIYDGNRWIHPDPKINQVVTFRDMKSNNYTAK